jgi:hypothetical protein
VRVKQVDDFLGPYRRRHRDLGRIEVGETGPDAARAGDDSGDAEANVVGPLVANHLRRHAGHDGALDRGRSIVVVELARQRGKEAARGGAEAHTHDIDLHSLAVWRFAHAG